MTTLEQAAEVIEALDPLAVGEEVDVGVYNSTGQITCWKAAIVLYVHAAYDIVVREDDSDYQSGRRVHIHDIHRRK